MFEAIRKHGPSDDIPHTSNRKFKSAIAIYILTRAYFFLRKLIWSIYKQVWFSIWIVFFSVGKAVPGVRSICLPCGHVTWTQAGWYEKRAKQVFFFLCGEWNHINDWGVTNKKKSMIYCVINDPIWHLKYFCFLNLSHDLCV